MLERGRLDPGSAALAFEHLSAFQLNGLGGEVVEEPSPSAEQNGDDVELKLVEDDRTKESGWHRKSNAS